MWVLGTTRGGMLGIVENGIRHMPCISAGDSSHRQRFIQDETKKWLRMLCDLHL